MRKFIEQRVWWELYFVFYLPLNLYRGYSWSDQRTLLALARKWEA